MHLVFPKAGKDKAPAEPLRLPGPLSTVERQARAQKPNWAGWLPISAVGGVVAFSVATGWSLLASRSHEPLSKAAFAALVAALHIPLALFLTSAAQVLSHGPGSPSPSPEPLDGPPPLLARVSTDSLPSPPRHCQICDAAKPARTHHCSACGKCIPKMDHHCGFLRRCIGLENLRFFVLFLGWGAVYSSEVAGGIFALLILRPQSPLPKPALALGFIGLVFGVVLSAFTAFHATLILRNRTTLESLVHRPDSLPESPSHSHASAADEAWDLGWRRNWTETMGPSPLTWFLPVPFKAADHAAVDEAEALV